MSIDVKSLPGSAADDVSVDTRQLALACMEEALQHLDSDATIPPIIGAHLQMAVDALRTNIDAGPAAGLD